MWGHCLVESVRLSCPAGILGLGSLHPYLRFRLFRLQLGLGFHNHGRAEVFDLIETAGLNGDPLLCFDCEAGNMKYEPSVHRFPNFLAVWLLDDPNEVGQASGFQGGDQFLVRACVPHSFLGHVVPDCAVDQPYNFGPAVLGQFVPVRIDEPANLGGDGFDIPERFPELLVRNLVNFSHPDFGPELNLVDSTPALAKDPQCCV